MSDRRLILLALPLVAALASSPPVLAQTPEGVGALLPSPTGPASVGTTTAYLTDTGRPDPDFPEGRPVTVQLWYPARRGTGAGAPYLVEPQLEAMLRRYGYYGVDSTTLRTWDSLRTHARPDALPARGPHPLVLFAVGLGVARANYTTIAEELASHGYLVALVDSPLMGVMVAAGGRAVLDTIGRYGDPDAHRAGVTDWSADLSFALDRLRAADASDRLGRIAETIDWSRIGALGHSSGGLVAVATCERESRVRACVNMDGGVGGPQQQPLADFVIRGLTKPALFLRSQPLYDSADFARRGLTREQWEARGEPGRLAFRRLVERSRTRPWVVQVAGTGHFSFSDAPFVMPSTITRFGGRVIEPRRGWTVITTVLQVFFDHELRGRGDGIAGLGSRIPEVTVVPP